MKWIEVIEVRSVTDNRKLMESQLRKLIAELTPKSATQTIRVYDRFMLKSDFSIHLFHDSTKIEKTGSTLGCHLVSNFKEMGLVNHRIWIEMDGQSFL